MKLSKKRILKSSGILRSKKSKIIPDFIDRDCSFDFEEAVMAAFYDRNLINTIGEIYLLFYRRRPVLINTNERISAKNNAPLGYLIRRLNLFSYLLE